MENNKSFSIPHLKELHKQLEGKHFVGGGLARKLISQQIKQLEEYQSVIRDAKTMWSALVNVEHYIDVEYLEDPEVVSKALMTPTAKFIEALYNANSKQDS